MPPSIAAPRCYGVDVRSIDEIWLWFEHVIDTTESLWGMPEYDLAAAALGAFGGAYLVGQTIPTAPWLTSDFLRRVVIRATPAVERLPSLRHHPVIGAMFPPAVADGVAHIWQQRAMLLHTLDRLPQTFCHFDTHRGNFLVRATAHGPQCVLLDWATAGAGPVGADAGMLIGVATQRTFFTAAEREQLDAAVFAHYLAGVRHAGWNGDEQLVRFGYTATMTLRILIGYLPDELRTWLDDSWHAAYEAQTGTRIGDFAAQIADPLGWLVARGVEALRLLPYLQRVLVHE